MRVLGRLRLWHITPTVTALGVLANWENPDYLYVACGLAGIWVGAATGVAAIRDWRSRRAGSSAA